VTLAQEHGTAAYVLDEEDFRSRARDFRDSFSAAFEPLAGADVYYAGKAFLCTAVARWVEEEGLSLDVCTGGELAVAQRVKFPGERIGFHGNNKSVAEIRTALTYGVGRIVVDSFQEIERIAVVAAELGVVARVMVRVTVGVEAHTHEFIATGHEDQKFGFSLAGGQAFEAATRILASPDVFDLLGLHSHIGSQIFDTGGFEMAAHRLVALHARIADEHGHHCPEIDLGGGYGIAYTSQHTPSRRARWQARWPASSNASSRPSVTATSARCPGSRSSPVAPSSGPARSPCTRWARSSPSSSAAATPAPTSRSTAA
jgi:diaminopimelate decarboxylase